MPSLPWAILEFWGHCSLESWWLLPHFALPPEEEMAFDWEWLVRSSSSQMSPPPCTNRGDSYPQSSGITAQPTGLLQQKITWTKNLTFFLLPNTAARDGWKLKKRKEGRWSSAIPVYPVFSAMEVSGTGIGGTEQHWWSPWLMGLVPPFPWCSGNALTRGSSKSTSSALLSYFTLRSFLLSMRVNLMVKN